MLTRERANVLLDRFRQVRVLVVGDLMLDRYVFGSVARISPEAPVPVLRVEREEARLGGASNVALNLGELGAHGCVCGLVGQDAAGKALKQQLARNGIGADGVVETASIQTSVKTRVVADRQQIVRVDRESDVEECASAADLLSGSLEALRTAFDAVIIEDYGKGVVTQPMVDAVLTAADGLPVGFDPKDNHTLTFPWLTVATPNYREACLAAGLRERDLGRVPEQAGVLDAAGEQLTTRWHAETLMITLGPLGVYVKNAHAPSQLLPTQAREVFDVSGAGDTFIAVAVTALAAGAQYTEAAELANHAAGVVVGKVGTATCSPSELLQSLADGLEPGGLSCR